MLREDLLISGERQASANRRQLLLFFSLAFLFSWLVWLPLLPSAQGWLPATFPFYLYYLGTVGPALSAIILTKADLEWEGVWALVRKLGLWRLPAIWYAAALLFPAVIRFAALGILLAFGSVTSDVSFRPQGELLWLFVLMLILVPLEEIGWRGYALPRLQLLYGPFRASLVIGVMWGLWHLPLMWVSGSYQETISPWVYMFVFTLTILPLSLLFTWIYNHTGGSLLIASLFHAAINVTEWALVISEQDGRMLLLTASALTAAFVVIVAARSAHMTNPRSGSVGR